MPHTYTPEPAPADLHVHSLVAEAGWSLVLETATDPRRPWCVIDWELPHGHRSVLATAFHDAVVARTTNVHEAIELLAAYLPPTNTKGGVREQPTASPVHSVTHPSERQRT